MEQTNLINETIASKLAGVSPTTLARFVEAGYLRVSNDSQGEKNYVKSEICSLFAVDAGDLEAAKEGSSDLISAIEISRDTSDSSDQDQATAVKPEEKMYWAETLSPELSAEQQEPIQNNTTVTPEIDAELVRLRNISAMQDKILEMREREIEDLRKERDWLRTRVERLEEKSERDQLLLLAETQTIKRLVNITHEKKPSTIRLALEWMGVVPPTRNESEIQNNKSKVIDSKS